MITIIGKLNHIFNMLINLKVEWCVLHLRPFPIFWEPTLAYSESLLFCLLILALFTEKFFGGLYHNPFLVIGNIFEAL
jgi:hypothetical protein